MTAAADKVNGKKRKARRPSYAEMAKAMLAFGKLADKLGYDYADLYPTSKKFWRLANRLGWRPK